MSRAWREHGRTFTVTRYIATLKTVASARAEKAQRACQHRVRLCQLALTAGAGGHESALTGSAHDRVTRVAQRRRHQFAVLRALRLQLQLHLRLREPEPRIGPYVTHIKDVSVDH